jgi:hypothetical protein
MAGVHRAYGVDVCFTLQMIIGQRELPQAGGTAEMFALGCT